MERATWCAARYGLDQAMAVGQEACLWFVASSNPTLVFAADTHSDKHFPLRIRVDRILHPILGEIQRIENQGLSYVFHLQDGRRVRVDAEQDPGLVEEGLSVPHVDAWTLQVELTRVPDPTTDVLAKAARGESLQGTEIAILVNALLQPDQGLADAAHRAILKVGTRALAELLEALRLPNEDLRYHILQIMITLGPAARDAVPALLDLARSQNGRICFRAAQAARAAGCRSSQVMEAVKDKSAEDRARILMYLESRSF